MKARIESSGGVASRVTLGGHEMVFDQPASVPGGRDLGPSPLDVMAAAVGACVHYFVAAYLSARKHSTEGLVVDVETEKVRDPSPRFGRFTIRIRLPSSVPEQYLAPIQRVVRGCPAYGTLVNSPDVELVFEQAP